MDFLLFLCSMVVYEDRRKMKEDRKKDVTRYEIRIGKRTMKNIVEKQTKKPSMNESSDGKVQDGKEDEEDEEDRTR